MTRGTSHSLAGRAALVTGAGSGIGRATALLLAERGASVAVLDIDRDRTLDTVAAIRNAGGTAGAAVCDVRDRAAVAAAVAAVSAETGPITILVNNAGVPGNLAPIEAIDEAAVERLFGIHVFGAYWCLQAVLPAMREAGWGRVVNISSNRGQVGFERSSHYAGAKAALLGVTKAWAKELAPHGINVNAVAPGVVLTGMTEPTGLAALREEADGNLMKRWAEAREIAYSIAFLASAEADYMTGQVLCPNGGDTIVGI